MKYGYAAIDAVLSLFDVCSDILISILGNTLQDVDLITLWAEETLIEANLVLDILFVAYYESFCTCNGERWKNLCSLYKVYHLFLFYLGVGFCNHLLIIFLCYTSSSDHLTKTANTGDHMWGF